MGVVSPLGTGAQAFHQGLADGADGMSSIEFPWRTAYKQLRAGQVTAFDFEGIAPDAPPMGRASQLAIAGAKQAMESAELTLHGERPDRIGVVVGTAMGDAAELEAAWQEFHAQSNGSASPDSRWMRLGNLSDRVADALGLEGPSQLVATTCAAGNHAIGLSAELLQSGKVDAMVAVAADTIGYVDILGFTRLLLQAPERCQPFDRHRKGTILSEGGAALALETLSGARRRGAPILAEIAGYGLSCDAAGPFASAVDDTRGMRVAFQRALKKARIAADEIDHVSAHGSATRLNDQKETLFLKEVLGRRAFEIPINGIKSMLGHAQGAASMFEAVASVLTFNHELIYPTMNYETPDPNCDLDYVPNQAREGRVDAILSNAFGVGGNNALVIFRRWSG